MRSSDLTLRRYTAADREAVWAVHRLGLQSIGSDSQRGPWDADLDHIEDVYLKSGEFLVGESDGRIVAIGGLRMQPGGIAELKRMRIHSDYYGRGYDQAMLDALTERALALRARYLTLDVDVKRAPAQELYQRNGFVARGRLLVGRTPSIVFEKSLEPTPARDVESTMAETIAAAGLTGVAAAWRRGQNAPCSIILGTDIDGAPLSSSSLFPTASLTKLAVALAVLRLVDQGKLDLDVPLERILPDAAAREGVTLRMLLCHTAGVPELPRSVQGGWSEISRSSLDTPADSPAGTRVAYSNLGYGLLGLAVERATGQAFGPAMQTLVFQPLGVDAHVAEWLPRKPAQGWRFRVLPAGGIFMTAAAALEIVTTFLHPPVGFVSPELVGEATRDQTGGLPGGMGPKLQWAHCAWGLGPEIRGDRFSPWIPRTASAESYGHAGASGCVAWADPAADIAWAILTVPPTDVATGIRWHLQNRPNLADIGQAILDST